MGLSLVAGPANAGKVTLLLERYLAALDHEPFLIVPNRSDVERVERDLLRRRPALLAGTIGTFDDLFRRIARAGATPPSLTELQRALLIRRVVGVTPMNGLAPSARFAGFADALAATIAELEAGMLEPDELEGDLARLYGAYRAELDRLGLWDRDLERRYAAERVAGELAAWDGRPVLAYGFEDLTGAQWTLLHALAGRADVTVSLPYEPGRTAFASLERTASDLSALAAGRIEELPPRYAEVAPAALAHLERTLFERPEPGTAPPLEGAIRFLEGAGARGVLELVGDEVLGLLRSGVAGEEIGIVVPSLERWRAPVSTALATLGVPFALEGRLRLPQTPFGQTLLALLRFAWAHGGRRDLFAFLRSPYSGVSRAHADYLEGRLRGRAVRDEKVEEETLRLRGQPLPLLDAVRAAESPLDAVRELSRAMLRAAYGLEAPPVSESSRLDLRSAEEIGRALDELQGWGRLAGGRGACPETPATAAGDSGAAPDSSLALAQASGLSGERVRPPAWPESSPRSRGFPDRPLGREDTVAALERTTVRLAGTAEPGRVAVCDLLRARTRRFEVVFLLGLEEGRLPRRTRHSPFLDDELRRELERSSRRGRLASHDPIARERYLFYTACTRASRRLYLVREAASEEGTPREPSPFWDEVRSLFPADEVGRATRRRPLSALTWPLEAAPSERERLRALASLAAQDEPAATALARTNGWERRLERARTAFRRPTRLTHPAVLAALAAQQRFSVTELEAFADCSSIWLVERVIAPRSIDAEVDARLRGSVAHQALFKFFSGLPKRLGADRVAPDRLDDALAFLRECLEEAMTGQVRLDLGELERRELEQGLLRDLEQFVRQEAASELPLVPRRFEVSFGSERSAPELQRGLELDGFALSGKIDRIDVDPFSARGIVQDYKSGKTAHSAARIESELRLQIPLYIRVLRDLIGIEPLGGVYRALSGERQARGLLRAEAADDGVPGFYKRDYLDEEAFWGQIDRAAELAGGFVSRIRAGDVRHDPRGGFPCPSWCELAPMCRVARA